MNVRRGHVLAVAVLLALFALSFTSIGVRTALASPVQIRPLLGEQPEHLKIDVCHATSSESNPFVLVQVSFNSVDAVEEFFNGGGPGGHGIHEGDSWASFPYGDGDVPYPGQGDVENCEPSPPPPPENCQDTDEIIGAWLDWEFDEESGLFVRTRTVTFWDGDILCGEITQEQTRGFDEAIVGLSLGCSRQAGDGIVYQLDFSVTVEPEDGATLTFNGTDYTASTGGHVGFGTYPWSAVASEDFTIVGSASGSESLSSDDCNESPPQHPPTGPTDGPINVAFVAAASILGLVTTTTGAVILRRRVHA